MGKLPAAYEEFQRTFRRVWEAYDNLGTAVHQAGPLDPKTRELIKLGIAIGGRLEGAVRAHTRLALERGAAPDAIRHVALLAITTSGFPTGMAALTWIHDVLRDRRKGGKRR
ncbi:MAG: carboxymuconolactone decarboxylase family protein [Candidatus Methylomirabilales bacterium]